VNQSSNGPFIPATTQLPELTLKAIIIAIILATLLAAANVYLALKIGATISASIPASVLAISILKFFKRSNILECNIIQTAASAGEGVAAAVSFILPAMIVLQVWNEFSFFESTIVTLLGGLLGVLFSIPLRRILLNMPVLAFPEGTAIGNVLISSAQKGAHLKNLIYGGLVGSLVSLSQTGLKIIADSIQLWRFTAGSVFGVGVGFSPAMLAAGYIIGVEVGITLLVGIIIGWFIVLPLIALHVGIDTKLPAYGAAMKLWSDYLRFVGVGNMLVAGVWTLISLLKPVLIGLRNSLKLVSKNIDADEPVLVPRTEKDISIFWVLTCSIIFGIMIYIFLAHLILELRITHSLFYLLVVTTCTVLYILIVGFMLAVICGYFTGLVGATNNPLSGILILALLLITLMYQGFFGDVANPKYIFSIIILAATIVVTIAAIANENLQDLKAGKMVGATPWKQQVMLGVGVIVASLVISPVLNLLFHAYGIAGVFPRPGMDKTQMLAAPQASIMAAVVKGVFTHQLNWNMILIGCGIAVFIIITDELLKRKNYRLPALAVGLGIYLPPEVTSPIIIGGVVNYIIKRSLKKYDAATSAASMQRGVLLACGMVAGSALMGVILAIPFVIIGSSDALMVVSPAFAPYAAILGTIVFLALCLWFYKICIPKKTKS